MNKRQNIILIQLCSKESGARISVEDFAQEYKVSEQTIRSDIKEINYLLQSHNQPCIIIRDNGIVDIEQPIDFSVFSEPDFYNYKLSPSERKTILAMLLLTTDGYTTIAELSDKIMVSRNTLINDLEDLKKWFAEHGLNQVSQPSKGLMVTGSEEQIRCGILKLLVLNDLIYEIGNKHSIFQSLLLHPINDNNQLDTIVEILKTAEEKHDIFLSDYSFHQMCYFLLVLVHRVQKGKIICDFDQEKWNLVYKSSKLCLAQDVLDALCANLGITANKMELAYIVEQLRCESYIKNNAPSRDTDLIEIQILIHEFIYKISRIYNIHYYLDFYLYDLLLIHIKALAYRVKQKHYLSNPLLEQLEAEYADMFQQIKANLKPLEDYLGGEISKDEVAFIVMYLLAILEKNKINDIQFNTLLVCNTGRGSAQLILAKLTSMFKQINVVDVVSTHQLQGMSLQGIDLILSTIPLGIKDVPSVQVSPLLSDADVNEIQNMVMQLQKQKRRPEGKPCPRDTEQKPEQQVDESILKEGSTLRDMLSADRVLLDANAADWREAVKLSGELLLKSGKVDEKAIRSMIESIEANGPYVVIYPSIAIPHVDTGGGAKSAAASFVRLSEPVQFNHKENDPVLFIIAFSVTDSTSIGRALYNLTQMLSVEDFLPRLKQAKSETELLSLVDFYESQIDVAGR